MHGLMMNLPLLVTAIMQFAERHHGGREIVSITADNPRHRYTYAEAFARARRLANALRAAGMQPGDRVGTLAWNDHRHFELYYGVACAGHVCHTINPRLFVDQISYIINHAGDRLLFVDPMFVPLVEKLWAGLATVEQVIVLTDVAHMPATTLPQVLCYEDWLAQYPDHFDWPELDENAACSLCYTSGTTGEPKGVLFSHRSTVLHSYAISLPDVMELRATECILPLVPMFHVNAWGTPYAVPMIGAKLVLPGPRMADGPTLLALINEEQVSYTLGVPTVWLALLQHLEDTGAQLSSLQRVCVGGAACPASVIDRFRARGVEVFHAWGMTEMSPVGTYNAPKASRVGLSEPERRQLELKQGRAVFGVDMKIVDEAGTELPWDGLAFGRLLVRGPWICSGYFGRDEAVLEPGGWFDTGDVATIDAEGYMQITDRNKDVIKSGGEWISSIALENIATDHPQVAEAAVIGRPHPRWGERPLLIVVPVAGATPDRAGLLAWFEGRVASWWVPDDAVLVADLPHTATGKLHKAALRERFADFAFSDTAGKSADDSAGPRD